MGRSGRASRPRSTLRPSPPSSLRSTTNGRHSNDARDSATSEQRRYIFPRVLSRCRDQRRCRCRCARRPNRRCRLPARRTDDRHSPVSHPAHTQSQSPQPPSMANPSARQRPPRSSFSSLPHHRQSLSLSLRASVTPAHQRKMSSATRPTLASSANTRARQSA